MYKGWYEQNWYPVVESQFSKKSNIWEAKHNARIWQIAAAWEHTQNAGQEANDLKLGTLCQGTCECDESCCWKQTLQENTMQHRGETTGAIHEDNKALPESRSCNARRKEFTAFLYRKVNCLKTELSKRQHSRREQLHLQHMTEHKRNWMPPWGNIAPIQIERNVKTGT